MVKKKISDEKCTQIITQNGTYSKKKTLKKHKSKIKRYGKRHCMISLIQSSKLILEQKIAVIPLPAPSLTLCPQGPGMGSELPDSWGGGVEET